MTRSSIPIALHLTRLAVLAVLMIAGPARAATVVLMRAPHPNLVEGEATVRLRGELTAEGFDVRVVEAPANADLHAALAEVAAGPDVEAVVAIFAAAPTDAVEVWVIDRVTGKTIRRRVPAEPPSARAAEILSIRALELLRASFLEIALGASRAAAPSAPEPAPPPPTTRPAPPEAPRAAPLPLATDGPRTWAVEAGGGLLASFEGMSSSVAPVVRIERCWRDRFVARLSVAGLGTRARVDTAVGTARVTQDFGLLEAAVKLRADDRLHGLHGLQPFASLGVGALHVASQGQAMFPYQVASDTLWTPIADLGVGVRLELRRRFQLALEVHAQVAARYPAIRVLGEEVARSERPTLVGVLTLVAWL